SIAVSGRCAAIAPDSHARVWLRMAHKGHNSSYWLTPRPVAHEHANERKQEGPLALAGTADAETAGARGAAHTRWRTRPAREPKPRDGTRRASERHAAADGHRGRSSIRALGAGARIRLCRRGRARAGVGQLAAPVLTAVGILPAPGTEEIRFRGARLRLTPGGRRNGAGRSFQGRGRGAGRGLGRSARGRRAR